MTADHRIAQRPTQHSTVCDRLRFVDALRRAQLMSSETRGVKVAATRKGITITSDNPDLGEVREELEAEYNAEPLAIGFQADTGRGSYRSP